MAQKKSYRQSDRAKESWLGQESGKKIRKPLGNKARGSAIGAGISTPAYDRAAGSWGYKIAGADMAQRERRSCKQDHALTPQVFPPSNLVLGPVLHRPGRSSVTLYQRTRFGCQRGSFERQKEWNLLLPDSEYLRPADRAGPLCSRSAVLECHWARITNLSFGPALHAICVHQYLLGSQMGAY